ncbi:MAG: helix-turn-helix domain-containing protein [Candidatus Limnocylindrales bacterium]
MDDVRLGRSLRAVRIRKGLRQDDVARRAGISQNAVSRAERGLIGGMTLERIRAIGTAVGVLIDLQPRWRGGELDRLLGARHSALHEAVAARFAALPGWTTVPEVTFSEYGERGAIDVLAWHAPTRTLLVIELKTELVDVQEMLGTLDRKRRLARKVAADRGWDAVTVAVWVILSEHRTNRRRVEEHHTVLRAALPADGRTMNAWLLAPRGPVAALSIWPRSDGAVGSRAIAPTQRVRMRAKAP